MNRIILFLLFTCLFTSRTWSQTILNEDGPSVESEISAEPLITEQIYRISQSKKIFILTNQSGQLNQGDFISLLTGNKLVARALVAKNSNGLAGIKILKIYSLRRWSLVREKMAIQVLRGDDTFYLTDRSKKEEDGEKIENEDDLYNDTKLLDEDILIEDKGKRLIKTDNILSGATGLIAAQDEGNDSTRYFHPAGSWAYQLLDNIWVEGSFGLSRIGDFPSEGLTTGVSSITIKAKYTFTAPFYSFIKPYVGFQVVQTDSPGAGEAFENDPNPPSTPELAREVELVEGLQNNTVVFGVTVLKRLVPGWFIRFDIGTDILAAGLALRLPISFSIDSSCLITS